MYYNPNKLSVNESENCKIEWNSFHKIQDAIVSLRYFYSDA